MGRIYAPRAGVQHTDLTQIIKKRADWLLKNTIYDTCALSAKYLHRNSEVVQFKSYCSGNI